MRVAYTLFLFISACQFVYAQGVWGNKNWNEWTAEDCRKILSKSPWATTQQNIEGQIETERRLEERKNAGLERVNTRADQIPSASVRLYSSSIIRKATIRLDELQSKLDKMSPSEKDEFERRKISILQCKNCEKYYIVFLFLVSTNGQTGWPDLLKGIGLKELKNSVYLRNDKGEKRQVVGISSPQRQSDPFVMYFPRQNEKGEPLLMPDGKKLKLMLDYDSPGFWKMYVPKEITFDVRKMMIDGKVDF